MKVWLLDIEYRKRETFAYSCEAYARVLQRGKNPAERLALAEEYDREVRISEERADTAEVVGIVREAAAARNGWKGILARCAPPRRRPAVSLGADSRASWASLCNVAHEVTTPSAVVKTGHVCERGTKYD